MAMLVLGRVIFSVVVLEQYHIATPKLGTTKAPFAGIPCRDSILGCVGNQNS